MVLLTLHSFSTPHGARDSNHAEESANQLSLRVDPNLATRDELMLLPRIGPALADAIIEYRTQSPVQPAFKRPQDLDGVRGIGPSTIARLTPFLHFTDSGV